MEGGKIRVGKGEGVGKGKGRKSRNKQLSYHQFWKGRRAARTKTPPPTRPRLVTPAQPHMQHVATETPPAGPFSFRPHTSRELCWPICSSAVVMEPSYMEFNIFNLETCSCLR